MMLINPDQPLTLANLMDLNRDEDLPSCKLPFVWKLYEMLEDVATSGNDHIVSWVGKGKGFKVHDMSKFVNKIIPMYFKQSKFKSFQRQLYFYNFKRISSGTEEGGYYHPQFQRGFKTRCLSMKPNKGKRLNKTKTITKSSIPTTKSACSHKKRQTGAPSDWTEKMHSLFDPGVSVTQKESSTPLINQSAEEKALCDGEMTFVFDGMPFHYLEVPCY